MTINTVKIPSGKSIVGEDKHEIWMDSFEMMDTPVTVEMYQEYLADTDQEPCEGNPNEPVVNINWHEANKFAEWLSKKTGEIWMLPNELQWEHAASCGGTWNPTDEEKDKHAWHYGNSGNRIHNVKEKEPNPWGLYDVLGNVWEWCSNAYSDYDALVKRYSDKPIQESTVLEDREEYLISTQERIKATFFKELDCFINIETREVFHIEEVTKYEKV